MCGRITLTRPNLESVATELNVAAEGYPRLPDSRTALQHRADLVASDSHAQRQAAIYLANDLGQRGEESSRLCD